MSFFLSGIKGRIMIESAISKVKKNRGAEDSNIFLLA
jgi:hypothetical protein